MRLLLFEHVCSGVDPALLDDADLLAQAAAMLGAVAADFASIDLEVVTLASPRAPLDLPMGQVEVVDSPDAVAATFDRLLGEVDAALVIAPETAGALAGWIERIEASGVRSLNATPTAARRCGDKLVMAEALEAAGAPTPTTVPLDGDIALAPPVIVKPRDGAGCERTTLCRDQQSVEAAVRTAGEQPMIVQPAVAGLAASASFLVADGAARGLPPGRQAITFADDGQVRYHGGELPLPPDLADRATRLGRRAVAAIDGLAGFVGVDLVLGQTADDDRVIEINPRITMSYVGLAELCTPSLAAAMLDPKLPLTWSTRRLRFDTAGRVRFEDAR